MAHYAKIKNNKVTKVIVAEFDFINSGLVGDPDDWIQTSYNTKEGIHIDPETGQPSEDQSKALRKNFAAVGFTYDDIRDAFIPPKPYDSWLLDEFKCVWYPPTPYPEDGLLYNWDEQTTSWVLHPDSSY